MKYKMKNRDYRPIRLCVLIILTGCSSIHLYDPERVAVSDTALEQLGQAQLVKLSEQKKEALDEQLAYALQIADETGQFLFESELFRMAANKDKTLLDWRRAGIERMNALGYENGGEVRDALYTVIDLEAATAKAKSDSDGLELLYKKPPSCDELPSEEKWQPYVLGIPDDFLDDEKKRIKVIMARYEQSC